MSGRAVVGFGRVISYCFLAGIMTVSAFGVTSRITRHSSGADLLEGEVDNVVVSSRGVIELGRASEVLVEEFKDVWSINCITVTGEGIFVGTSPNGGIYKYSMGKLTEVYSAEPRQKKVDEINEPNDVNEPADANVVVGELHLANEHIFAMAVDISGRLLAGISGEQCRLVRFGTRGLETIFEPEPNDAKYIFAIAVSDGGDIYLGTGPEGKIYKLNSFGKNAKLVYDSRDKNILSLAVGGDGFIYAGSDSRGLVYKIAPVSGTTTVLYDSDSDEITAVLFGRDGYLYAAATSAKIVSRETKFASAVSAEGRPEIKLPADRESSGEKGLKLNVANTKKEPEQEKEPKEVPSLKGVKPAKASFIYKITNDGFVTEVFREAAVFFCLAEQGQRLFLGTGNDGRLFTIEPAREEKKVVYEDKQASQITAVVADGRSIYIGTANPAKLIKVGANYASDGTYTSPLIDAGQPARWGKLQIEADIPRGSKVLAASRSGNVEDVNAPTYSDWTAFVKVVGPVSLDCPVGRFCQYKLALKSLRGNKSPLVREIAVAHTVPNIAPRVKSVDIERIDKTGQEGMFKISYQAGDENKDELIYKIDFRKEGRAGWIEIEDEIEADNFEWDGKTVEDGRYEIRVTASDERSNTKATKLTASRISESIVVDNTGPAIEKISLVKKKDVLTVVFRVSDKLSAIGQMHFTVDSNTDWKGTLPKDLVFDTTEEDFEIVVDELTEGEHVISLRIRDAVGNTTYKSFEF